MTKQIFVFENQAEAVAATAEFILDWCVAHPGSALGGATGRSPIGVWKTIWDQLAGPRQKERAAFTSRNVIFLDEYFGAYPSYYHWAWRHLRVAEGGFAADRVFTPRGCFFENGRIVSSHRLEEILSDWPDDWRARTLPGEDGIPPEVRISSTAEHPVLVELRDAMREYDRLARDHSDRLQLLGIGVGGAVARDPAAGGHIGFVEYGAAEGESSTMLVRLAPSTRQANRDDFRLNNAEGELTLEPTSFAVTQGVGTILSAGRLLMMGWGASKREAVSRMFLGAPHPKNPAAWVQTHPAATVFLDRAALGELSFAALASRGWDVVFNPRELKVI